MLHRYEDANCEEAHQKAFELGEFRMLIAKEAVSGQIVQFRGQPAIIATLDHDLTGVPEGFVEVDICPYF